jgi:PRC-barrel domain
MTNRFLIAATLSGFTAIVSPTLAVAQGAAQTITAVDVKVVATGYRTSKIVGSTVVNDAKESIGKIDDLIIAQDKHIVFAGVSVGGFLGAGAKLVAVQYDQLRPTPDNQGFVLAGATKDSLKALPEFSYSK